MLMTSPVAEPGSRAAGTFPPKKILLISPDAGDCDALGGILDTAEWDIWPVATGRDALALLMQHRFCAVFCEAALKDLSWKELLTLLPAIAGAPPLVLISCSADVCLWCEALNLGGYDVLAKPFYRNEVAHVVRTISLREQPQAVHFRLKAGAAAG
jgi:DNA-binding NtrC family response regulator